MILSPTFQPTKHVEKKLLREINALILHNVLFLAFGACPRHVVCLSRVHLSTMQNSFGNNI